MPFIKAATDTGSAEYEERPWGFPGCRAVQEQELCNSSFTLGSCQTPRPVVSKPDRLVTLAEF